MVAFFPYVARLSLLPIDENILKPKKFKGLMLILRMFCRSYIRYSW